MSPLWPCTDLHTYLCCPLWSPGCASADDRYPRSHAEERLADNIPKQRALIDQLKSILPPTALTPDTPIRPPAGAAVIGSPFTDVWDVETGMLVGNFNFSPHTDASYADEERVTAATTEGEMLARPPGEQVWYFGYVMSAALGGKGVMGEVVGCVVEGWVKPWMGVGTVGGVSLPCPRASSSLNRFRGCKGKLDGRLMFSCATQITLPAQRSCSRTGSPRSVGSPSSGPKKRADISPLRCDTSGGWCSMNTGIGIDLIELLTDWLSCTPRISWSGRQEAARVVNRFVHEKYEDYLHGGRKGGGGWGRLYTQRRGKGGRGELIVDTDSTHRTERAQECGAVILTAP